MVAQKFLVDLNKPLVSQVGHLGEDYDEWVHEPIVSKEGPRFFQSDFLEVSLLNMWLLSSFLESSSGLWRNTPCTDSSFILKPRAIGETPFIIFSMAATTSTPWIALDLFSPCCSRYISSPGKTPHRLKQSMQISSEIGQKTFFRIIWNLVKLVCPPSIAPAVFGGILLGYVMYDCTHYYLHHGQPKSEVPKSLKKYHLNHHYRLQNYGFGITSPLWDKVFGTVPPPQSKGEAKRR
ncbi:hypothetical protein ACSQ67_004085 [Phaseolus vulgaris]